MTVADFRRLALALPGVVEGSHMGHADFRVRGKIFATLGARPGCGMVKLTPADQAHLMRANPKVFSPAAGAWGTGGSTVVVLKAARVAVMREALQAAWEHR
jgi:hypothetical protein